MIEPINPHAAVGVGARLLDSAQQSGSGNYIIDLYKLLAVTVNEPGFYGAFHLSALAIVIGLTVYLCTVRKNATDRTFRRIMLAFWICMIVAELIDQFVCGTTLGEDGILSFHYRWWTFPFQLCATGIWVLPFIVFMRDSRARDAMILYMGLFSLFGGLLVCVCPVTVFTDVLVTNIHTMVQHGSQVALGIFILVNKRDKLCAEGFMGSCVVFASLVLVATVMNDVMYNVLAAYGIDDDFNMFYISPHYNSGMPVLSVVYDAVPWGVYMLLYIVGFILIALMIYAVARHAIRSNEAEIPAGELSPDDG